MGGDIFFGRRISNTREQIRATGISQARFESSQHKANGPTCRGSTTWRRRDSPDHIIQCFTEKTVMTKFNILGTAAVLSLMFATPVFAQAAIQEPGAFAFAYPNNDVLNGGRPTPSATRQGGPYASIDPQAARMDSTGSSMPVVFGSNPYGANPSVAMN